MQILIVDHHDTNDENVIELTTRHAINPRWMDQVDVVAPDVTGLKSVELLDEHSVRICFEDTTQDRRKAIASVVDQHLRVFHGW